MWYRETVAEIKALSPDVKLTFAFHIQPWAFVEVYSKYGFENDNTQTNPINIDLLENKEDGDFGYLGQDVKSAWDGEFIVWNSFKELGVDSILVGHEHCNSASVVYQGIRCQYGQKSSTYDRLNYWKDGKYISASCQDLPPVVGGTVLPLSEDDGSIVEPYIYLCNTTNENE